jgi:ABC-2 type transport system permease protein
LLVPPVAFFAGVGRGYLAPMGVAIFLLILAQVVAAAGWGEYFPWSIPALHAGLAGPEAGRMGAISYALVLVTSLLGIAATLVWWERADQAN